MFSVIMPAYNCVKYVENAVKSVLNQTFVDLELIVVDDGSTDGTFELLKKISEKDDRMTVYTPGHGGVSRARNFGIEKSRGERILFIDSDDSWESSLLEECAKVEDVNLLLFGITAVYYTRQEEIANVVPTFSVVSTPTKVFWMNEIDSVISTYDMASPCNKVYSKAILDKYNIRFCEKCVALEDFKFNLDYLSHINEMYVINKDLYKYRLYQGENQLFKRNYKELFENADELYLSAENLVKSLNSSLNVHRILSAVVLLSYYQEFCKRTYGESKKTQRYVLKILNGNRNYNKLLRHTKGCFFMMFKLFKMCGLNSLQTKAIWRRYL